MNRFKAFAIASCLGLLALAFLPASKADEWNKRTKVEIKEPVAIPGQVLQPGEYIFKLMDSPADRHIVQIYKGDESGIVATILAIPTYQLTPANNTEMIFWETPAGQPRALKAWFFPGDNYGQEFAYPKETAATLAQTNNTNVPTVAENNQIAETTPSGQTQALSQNNSEQNTQSNATSTEPNTMAQSTQPSTMNENLGSTRTGTGEAASAATNESATSAAPAPQTTNENATSAAAPPQTATDTGVNNNSNARMNQTTETAQNQALPRTASPLPLMGLAGLVSLGAALAARFASKVA